MAEFIFTDESQVSFGTFYVITDSTDPVLDTQNTTLLRSPSELAAMPSLEHSATLC